MFIGSGLLFAGILLPISSMVDAATQQDVQRVKEQITRVQNDTHHKHEEHGVLGVEANSLSEAINKLQAQINTSEARVGQLQREVDTLNRQIVEAEAEVERQRAMLKNVIRQLYVDGDISSIEILASSPNFSDYVDKQAYRASVSENIQAAVDRIEALKKEMSAKRETVKASLAEQQALRSQLAAQRAEKDRILALNQQQQNVLENEIKENSNRLAQLKKEQAAAEAAVARALASRSYQRKAASSNAVSSGNVSAGDVVGAIGNTGFSTGPHLHLEMRGPSGITSPIPHINRQPIDMPPGWVSQQYGVYNPIYRSGYHTGIDYAARSGAPIYAIADGKMYRGCSNDVLGTARNNYGYVAIVEHPNGLKSIYAHMSGGPAECNYNTY